MTFSTLGTDTQSKQPITINKTVRPQGLYIVGRQGTGKSGLLENLIIQDIKQGLGVCVVDPHHTGGIIDDIIARLPANREQDVILLDIRDNQFPFGLNLFSCSDPTDDLTVQEVVDRVMHVFDKLLGVTPETPLIRQYLRNCTYTLVANPGFTMAEILLLLTDKHCRQKLVANVTDPQVLVFWKQYEAFSPNVQEERSSSLQRRVEEFLQRLTNNIVGQSNSTIDFRAIMDDQKILLVKLDSLRLSSITNLIGSLFIAAFLTAASTRMRKQNIFNIYADEFQNFATEDFVKLIEEARKFGIGITIAHQNRAQLELSNKQAEIELKKRVLNVGSLVVFCVPTDAQDLAGQFDITPQAAWEEEIEKEWVEVLKEEWFERLEEVIEDGVEEIKTPVSSPFDWLVSGHTHDNPVVNRYVDGTLRKLHTALSSEYTKDVRAELNSFLYQAMTSNDPLKVLTQKSCISVLLQLNDWYPFSPYYFDQTVAAEYDEETTQSVSYLPARINAITGQLPSLQLDRKTNEPNEKIAAAIFALIRASDEVSLSRAASLFETLALAKLTQRVETYLIRYQEFYQPINYFRYAYTQPNTSVSRYGYSFKDGDFFSPEEEAQRCRKLPEKIIAEERQALEGFIAFLKEFRDFVFALAKEPITSGSGLSQPRKRTQLHYLTHPRETITHPRKTIMHPQRTYADMLNELASQLVDLPDYVARVKIKGEPEHLIQTLDPKKQADKPLYGQLLDNRIERIKLHNRTAGYIRPRQEVEIEISMRQDALRQTAQPQKIVQEPLELPKRERRIPLQSAASDKQLAEQARELEQQFQDNNYHGRVSNPSVLVKKGHVPIVISPPHAVIHPRNGIEKDNEMYTGALALQLADRTGASAIIYARTTKDDPNYDKEGPYKEKLAALVRETKAVCVLDLHGMAESFRSSNEIIKRDIIIGTVEGKTLLGRGEFLDILQNSLHRHGMTNVTVDEVFNAGHPNTITSYTARELKVPAMQVEISVIFRKPSSRFEKYANLLLALCEAINAISLAAQAKQPIAASDSNLEQELMKLWREARDKRLTSLEFNEWREQELANWLKKLKDTQQ